MYPLKPNGGDVPLTNKNRIEYTNLYVKYLLNDSIQESFCAFKNGFLMFCGGFYSFLMVTWCNGRMTWFQFDETLRVFLHPFLFSPHCVGNALSLLKPIELELLICGSPDIDFKKIQSLSKYSNGFTSKSITILHFWELIYEMRTEQKKKLLFFISGTDRIPFEVPFFVPSRTRWSLILAVPGALNRGWASSC